MAIYIGLNVSKGMVDVNDPVKALQNLGLSRDDFALISGLSQAGTDVGITDFHNTANLSSDQKVTLFSLSSAADTTFSILQNFEDIRSPLSTNLFMDNSRLAGGSISFKYLDFASTEVVNGSTVWKIKNADISTSRISSWSPIGPVGNEDSHIMFGGQVEVIGDHVVFEDLHTTTPPIKKKFRSEVSTHVLRLKTTNSSGTVTYRNMIAMKGIPLTFKANFQDVNLSANISGGGRVDSNGSVIPMTWQITNKNPEIGTSVRLSWNTGDGTIENPGSLGLGSYASPASYQFTGTQNKERVVEFFYDPAYIQSLSLNYAGLTQWINVTLPALHKLSIEGNDLQLLPEFRDDADLAVSGVDGGLGLAPTLREIVLTGNNLTRATAFLRGRSSEFLGLTPAQEYTDAQDKSWAEGAGTASAQLNRLPLTMEKIVANGCFSDSTTIDLKDYLSLTSFTMVADYQEELTRRQPRQLRSPEVYNPEVTTGLIILTDLFPNSSSTSVITHPNTVEGQRFRDRLYDGGGTGTQKYVKVNFRNKPSNPYTRGTSGSGLSDGEVIVFEKTATLNSTLVKNLAGTQLKAINATTDGGYSFTKCDSSGNIIYDDSASIVTYNIHEQLYTGLAPGVYKGINTNYVDIRHNNLSTNSEYPYYDANNTSASTADMVIPAFRSTNLGKFYSENNNHNIIDMTNKTKLTHYNHRRSIIDNRYSTSEKSFDNKFDGCTALQYFNMYYVRRSRGDFKTNGMFRNKANLWFVDLRWGWARGSLRDDLFQNSPNINYFLTAGDSYGEFTNDFFATQNSDANHRGATFKDCDRLRYWYSYYHTKSSARFDNPDNSNYNLDLSASNRLYGMYLRKSNIRGTLPNLSTIPTLRWLDIRQQRFTQSLRHIQGEVTYTIKQLRTDSNNNKASTAIWNSIGLTGSPNVGDTFVAQFVDPAVTTLQTGFRYMIRDKGTTSDSNWGSLGAGSSPYQGQVFTATGVSSGGISGTGAQLMPYCLDKVESKGLEGNLPAFAIPYLHTVRANINSFSGQFPVWDCPRLKTLWMNDNKFTGNIPDFSKCRQLKIVRLQDNSITGYIPGSLRDNTALEKLNLDNNRLSSSIATDLIYDLYENYNANPRSGVVISMIGQSGGGTLNNNSIVNDGTEGPSSSANKLASLRNNGWSITLD